MEKKNIYILFFISGGDNINWVEGQNRHWILNSLSEVVWESVFLFVWSSYSGYATFGHYNLTFSWILSRKIVLFVACIRMRVTSKSFQRGPLFFLHLSRFNLNFWEILEIFLKILSSHFLTDGMKNGMCQRQMSWAVSEFNEKK